LSKNDGNGARETGVARTTVTGYLDILEETLLCFRLPAYEAKLRVRERKLPKLYWCDPGIVRVMKRATGTLALEEKGALFEGMVAQLLRAYKDYRGICDDIYYWAPAGRSAKADRITWIKEGYFLFFRNSVNVFGRWSTPFFN